MRILLATGIYPPEIGGPATYSKLLHDELPKRGIAVDVLPFSTVRHLPNVLRQIHYFLKVLRHGSRCDVIYAQDAVSVGWPAFFANIFLRKAFIVKIVGDQVWEQGKQRFGVTEQLDDFPLSVWRYGLWLGWLRFLQFRVARHAHQVIVPSEYLKKVVLSWGVDLHKVTVIYNGFDVPGITTIRSTRVGAGQIIVSIGRLVSWKGFATLIDLIPEIQKQAPGVKLIIVGDGPERANLESKVKDKKLTSYVIFTGQVSHGEVLSYLKVANLFVLNTAYEGLSHQILEALAMGVPVVTTRVGGNPELIQNGKNGLLVTYNHHEELITAVTRMLGNSELAQRCVQGGYKSITRFNTESMLDQVVTTLQQHKRT